MPSILAEEVLLSLDTQFPCRSLQIRQLATLFNPARHSPSTIIIYGLPSTGKSSITRNILEALSTPHVYVNCAECITARHFFEKTVSIILEALYSSHHLSRWQKKLGRCENLAALCVQLQLILEGHDGKFVLALDGVDKQREASPTLLPALARLGELIPHLTTTLILSTPSPRPLLLHSAGVSHIYFPPYSQKEALTIALASPPPLVSTSESFEPTPTLSAAIDKFYPPFVSTLLAALIIPTTSLVLPTLRSATAKLWPLFLTPIVGNEAPPGLNTTPSDWDFPRLLLRNRPLFQSESVILDRLVSPELPKQPALSSSTQHRQHNSISDHPKLAPSSSGTLHEPAAGPQPKKQPLLPYLPTLILLSALLASTVPPKQDIVIFSSLSSRKKSIRRRRSKHQASSTTSTPTKSRVSKITASTSSTPTRPFPLERLIAILRTVVSPSDLSSAGSSKRGTREPPIADLVYAEIPMLERLKLIVTASAAGEGDPLGDVKYRINVPKEFVKARVREWKMDGDWRGWEDAGVF